MTKEELDALCMQAMERINTFINRVAAQQLRRMREEWRKGTMSDVRLCQLQVNVGTGAWRTVMDFDVGLGSLVMDQSEQLFLMGDTKAKKGIRLRIMKPGDTAPLMDWSENEGWQEWRHAT